MGRFMLALVTLRWCAHARRPRHIGNFSRLLQRKLEQAAECYEQALKMKLEVLGTGHRCAWAAAAAAASAAAPVTPVKTVADEQGNQGVVASTMQPTATFTLLPLAPHTRPHVQRDVQQHVPPGRGAVAAGPARRGGAAHGAQPGNHGGAGGQLPLF